MQNAYFERVDERRFRAGPHTSGAWNPDEQHISPAMGVMLHCIERDRDRRRDDSLAIGRISYDILGTVPVGELSIDVHIVRPGRTIELVEARLEHGGRTIVLLRAWLLQARDTSAIAGTEFARIPPRAEMQPWDPTTIWPGGFLASAEVLRREITPGRAAYWVRPTVELIAGEPVSALARAAGLVDIANGMTVRSSPARVAFPNVDLTAHFFGEPAGDWIGFDTTVSFGSDGLGLTHSVLHREDGPIGTLSQILTVRPS